MQIEKITVNKLIADEGKILTDGETYGEVAFLGEDRKASEFREITLAEYEEIKAKLDAEASIEE